jgi:regulator of replication initiation timing
MPNRTVEESRTAEGFISASQEIDVDRIMEAIKNRIREKKESGVLKQSEIEEILDMELLPLPDFLEVPNVYEPHLYPGEAEARPGKKEFHPLEISFEVEAGKGYRGLIKKILIKIRKVVFPLVRFMVRPIYNELKQFGTDRYNENARKIFRNTEEIEYYRQLVIQSKEYIKLLHNALNNLITEASKLKIDHELLKTRLKVLEDKMEFLENRERALEKKVFPPLDAHNQPES